LLPVEGGRGNRYGDAIETALGFDAANKFGVALVAPSFSALPWYADHPSDERVAQESYFLKDVVPLVEANYPVIAERRGRLLCGFSKSGWGAWSLLLRHPDVFERAASWDAPLTMDAPGKYGSGPIFGTAENFAKYQITKLIDERAGSVSDRSSPRLILLGYGSFTDHRPLHEQLDRLHVPHVYRDGPKTEHVWSREWLEPALTELTK
jgi:enterochelin esterase-like enzyme